MNKTENNAPNIVLIITDQQRWDTLGCLGYDHVITPHIDRLAARGVAFSRAFVQGAVCGPSRNSIVSGQYVHTHGIDRNEAWKLVFYLGEPYGELYHLAEDPDELYNLYDDPAHARARGAMVERMMDWYGKTRMQR